MSDNMLMKQALGGWQVTGIYTVRTGVPFNYSDFTNNNSGYQVARYQPAAGIIPKHSFTKIPSGVTGEGANSYHIGDLPAAVSFANPALPAPGLPGGISDWGPFPAGVVAPNNFRRPGASTLHAACRQILSYHL